MKAQGWFGAVVAVLMVAALLLIAGATAYAIGDHPVGLGLLAGGVAVLLVAVGVAVRWSSVQRRADLAQARRVAQR